MATKTRQPKAQPLISEEAQRRIDEAVAGGTARSLAPHKITIRVLHRRIISPPTNVQKTIINMYLHENTKKRADMAAKLGKSKSTVGTQIYRLFSRLGVHDWDGLIEFYKDNPELASAHGVNNPEKYLRH